MANLTILEALNKSLAATKKYVDDNKVTDASEISIQDTANNFTATNVEGALAELFQFVSNGKILIASAITDMGIDTSNTDSFETMANKIRAIVGNIGEQPLYKFGLLSDAHIDGDGTDEAYSISDLTNAISFLENAGASFIAYTGDMAYDGRDEDYTALKTCLDASTVPNYCVRGNHDASSLANGYASATGCEEDYIVTQGNDLLIFLSPADDNHDTGGLTKSKLDWLEKFLQANSNTRVFLFYHYFVQGTSGNGTGAYPHGKLNPNYAIALRFINMVKQYPNLIFCNGHSHLRFNVQDQDANANYYHNNGECYYIHVPSVSRPRYPSGDSYINYYEGSEGYLVEVYADKVIFKPIDFIASEYLTKYNYTANVVQGANEPTIPSKPSGPTIITYEWQFGGIGSSSGSFDDSKTTRIRTTEYKTITNTTTFTCNQGYEVRWYRFNASDHSFVVAAKVWAATFTLEPNDSYVYHIGMRRTSNANMKVDDASNLTITVSDTPSEPVTIDITWNDGVKIGRSDGVETSNEQYSASNLITRDNSKTYTLNLASSMTSFGGNVFICYYDESQSFISISDNFLGNYDSAPEVFTTELSFPSNAKYFKLRFYSSNAASKNDKSVITLTTTNSTS